MDTLKKWLAANKLALAFFLIIAVGVTSFYRNRQDDQLLLQELYDLAVEMVVEIDFETGKVEFDTGTLDQTAEDYTKSAESLEALLQKEEFYIQQFDAYPGRNISQQSTEYLQDRISNHRNLSLWLRLEEYQFSQELNAEFIELDDELRSRIQRYASTYPSQSEQQQVETLLDLEPVEWDTVSWPKPSPRLKTRRLLSQDHTAQLQSIRAEIDNIEKELDS